MENNSKFSTLKWRISRITGITCLVVFIMLLGMIFSDLVKSEYSFSVTPASYPPVKMTTAGGFYMHSLIIVGAGKAKLQIDIIDEDNKIVYEYEPISTVAYGTILEKNTKFHIPPLPVGTYRIAGILYYSANLIMQSKIHIDMGTIIVED